MTERQLLRFHVEPDAGHHREVDVRARHEAAASRGRRSRASGRPGIAAHVPDRQGHNDAYLTAVVCLICWGMMNRTGVIHEIENEKVLFSLLS